MSTARRPLTFLAGACAVAATMLLASASAAAAAVAKPAPAASPRAPASAAEQARWAATARRVTIMRDTWGIPHVFGKSDADAVFGLLYAQAEDDFNRVELNYINALGRLAEVEGEQALWRDLRMKLYITPQAMRARYAASPPWLRELMTAFADGLNFYLARHPEVKPKLIGHFEPWMALAFSEGSIGGDIESIDLKQLAALYDKNAAKAAVPAGPALASAGQPPETEPRGSNGFAIAPARTAGGHALLLINPHTSFYFRPEVHMVSEQGLNAYGAVTWGQFFVYQGFNERAGWMHTSGGGDVIDEYLETVVEQKGKWYYRYEGKLRPVRAVDIKLPYKTATGMASKTVTAHFTHHGPVVRQLDGKWVAVRMMDEPLKALTQSYTRTKATSYAQFKATMALRTNSSNNTVYADADGTIAYFHGNFIPRRDASIDWAHPVDGSVAATEWQGLHTVDQTITLHNPASGYILNTNNWPFAASGASSPTLADFPKYMWALPENARGAHAVRVLKDKTDFTIDSLTAAAYDSYLTEFEPLLPQVLADWDALAPLDPLKARLAGPVAALRGWDLRYGVDSVPTSVAVYWGQQLVAAATPAARAAEMPAADFIISRIGARERLDALAAATAKLNADFGSWQTPWGDINRFQRLSGDVVQRYDDSKPSWPVPFASATWGSLAAFGMVAKQTTKRIYGDRGNSFVAVVEFGPTVRARSILAGGQSADPASIHFADQAEMYSKGQFKDVLFYPADIAQHLERQYHPGQ
ncbi:penicillin acylase family protein [Massilia sp. DWR3-1-1]|uniref:penicillin acylase family protein n=1 Tax=Massilia sp. DWR3-1-1 TaxID=2804559 RepID=UPI003CF8AF66